MKKKEWGIGRQTEEMEELYEEDGINGRKKRKGQGRLKGIR